MSNTDGLLRHRTWVARIYARASKHLTKKAKPAEQPMVDFSVFESNELTFQPQLFQDRVVCKRCKIQPLSKVDKLFGMCYSCLEQPNGRDQIQNIPQYDFSGRNYKRN